jgi:hypothetical protein
MNGMRKWQFWRGLEVDFTLDLYTFLPRVLRPWLPGCFQKRHSHDIGAGGKASCSAEPPAFGAEEFRQRRASRRMIGQLKLAERVPDAKSRAAAAESSERDKGRKGVSQPTAEIRRCPTWSEDTLCWDPRLDTAGIRTRVRNGVAE